MSGAIQDQQQELTRLGRRIIDQAERITELNDQPVIESMQYLAVYLPDLEAIIRRYRAVEQALLNNQKEIGRRKMIEQLNTSVSGLMQSGSVDHE